VTDTVRIAEEAEGLALPVPQDAKPLVLLEELSRVRHEARSDQGDEREPDRRQHDAAKPSPHRATSAVPAPLTERSSGRYIASAATGGIANRPDAVQRAR
jgi:hypothetical protein